MMALSAVRTAFVCLLFQEFLIPVISVFRNFLWIFLFVDYKPSTNWMRYRNTFRALISFFRYWTSAKTAVCIERSGATNM